MKKIFFIIPFFKKSITGGTSYDINLGKSLKENFIYQKNIFIDPNATNIRIALLFNKIPRGATVCVDGLLLPKIKNIISTLTQKFKIIILMHHPSSLENSSTPFANLTKYYSERIVLNSELIIVTVSHYIKNQLSKFLNKPIKIYVAEPGIDDRFFIKRENYLSSHVLTIGNVIPRKGYHILIDALQKIDCPWILNIIGDCNMNPKYFNFLKEKILKYQLQKKINFVGTLEKDEMIEYIKKSMIFVLPTRYEGFGISLLEAAVSGLRVITTNIPVLRESLKDQNVIFFEIDNVNDLSEKIQTSLQKSNSVDKIQSKQLYGWKSTKTKFLRVLNETR